MADKVPSKLIRDLSERYRYVFDSPGGPYMRAAPEGAAESAELRRRQQQEALRTPADPMRTAVRGYAHLWRSGGVADKAAAGLGVAVLEAAQAATLLGGVRYNPHPVRGPLRLNRLELGSRTVDLPNRMTVPLPNAQASSPYALVSKTGLAHPPGDYAYMTAEGRVVIPTETADLMRSYGREYMRFPDGKRAPLETAVAWASDIDASTGSRAAREDRLRELNDAVNPLWMYRMYERDILRANRTLEKANGRAKARERGAVDYDILSREAAATVLSNPLGTSYRMWAPQTGETVFRPVAVSGMHKSRFDEHRQFYDAYNAGYLPVQAEYYEASARMIDGGMRIPTMRVGDHYDTVVAPAESRIPVSDVKRGDMNRTAYVRGTIPRFGLTPVDPGGITAVYRLDDGRPVFQPGRQFAAGVSTTQLADKAGDSPHRNFRNFLATDEVPETIFGYPVVQDESGYTQADLEFFRKNPKAAGFYDLGDGEMDEDAPRQAWGSGRPAWSKTRDPHLAPFGKYGAIGAPRNWMERQVFRARGLNEWGGTLDPDEDRPWHIFRDRAGKITGYGTTRTVVVPDGDDYVVIPTIVDGKAPMSDEEAYAHYRRTGKKWATVADPGLGGRLGEDLHARHAENNQRKWDEFILAHWDEMADDIKDDPYYIAEHDRRRGADRRIAARQDDKGGFARKFAAFKDHVKRFEERRTKPYLDVDGNYAVGYGSHFLADGSPVTAATAVDAAGIDAAFDRDLEARAGRLARTIPGWRRMSPDSRLMLLDVSWGRNDAFSEERSPGLNRDLRAAGTDRAKLDAAVLKHYPSYRKAYRKDGTEDATKRAGLQNRRAALMKMLTGEDFSYEGKKWDPELGFVNIGG